MLDLIGWGHVEHAVRKRVYLVPSSSPLFLWKILACWWPSKVETSILVLYTVYYIYIYMKWPSSAPLHSIALDFSPCLPPQVNIWVDEGIREPQNDPICQHRNLKNPNQRCRQRKIGCEKCGRIHPWKEASDGQSRARSTSPVSQRLRWDKVRKKLCKIQDQTSACKRQIYHCDFRWNLLQIVL